MQPRLSAPPLSTTTDSDSHHAPLLHIHFTPTSTLRSITFVTWDHVCQALCVLTSATLFGFTLYLDIAYDTACFVYDLDYVRVSAFGLFFYFCLSLLNFLPVSGLLPVSHALDTDFAVF